MPEGVYDEIAQRVFPVLLSALGRKRHGPPGMALSHIGSAFLGSHTPIMRLRSYR